MPSWLLGTSSSRAQRVALAGEHLVAEALRQVEQSVRVGHQLAVAARPVGPGRGGGRAGEEFGKRPGEGEAGAQCPAADQNLTSCRGHEMTPCWRTGDVICPCVPRDRPDGNQPRASATSPPHTPEPTPGPTPPHAEQVSASPRLPRNPPARPLAGANAPRVRAAHPRCVREATPARRAAPPEGRALLRLQEALRVPRQGRQPGYRPEVLLPVAALEHLLAEELVERHPGGQYRDLPVVEPVGQDDQA